MTADLAGFLLAQLDADETVARAATGGPWAIDTSEGFEYHVRTGGTTYAVPPTGEPIADAALDSDAAHIALHDPVFELDRIAALRTVVELHAGEWRDAGDAGDAYLACIECDRFGWPCRTLLALAQPYRGRPGWRDEWGTG